MSRHHSMVPSDDDTALSRQQSPLGCWHGSHTWLQPPLGTPNCPTLGPPTSSIPLKPQIGRHLDLVVVPLPRDLENLSASPGMISISLPTLQPCELNAGKWFGHPETEAEEEPQKSEAL